MKYRIILFIIFIIILFSGGCEQTIDGIDLPYQELIVVRGVLEAGKPIKNISITKTLPPLEVYSIRSAEIKDAEAFITCDGQKYPLKYIDSSNYNTDNLIALPGKQYELTINWNGKTAYSKTIVPFAVTIDTTHMRCEPYTYKNNKYHYYEYFVEIEFTPQLNSVYLASFIETHKGVNYEYSYTRPGRRVDKPEEIYPDGKIHSLLSYGVGYIDTLKFPPFEACIDSYDKPFYDYFLTRDNMSSSAEDFLTKGGGKNVIWNVSGDAIGLFIGKATSRKKSN